MADQKMTERKTIAVDRRISKMDRRQFIDIGWPIQKERRVALTDRRQGPGDRRGE